MTEQNGVIGPDEYRHKKGRLTRLLADTKAKVDDMVVAGNLSQEAVSAFAETVTVVDHLTALEGSYWGDRARSAESALVSLKGLYGRRHGLSVVFDPHLQFYGVGEDEDGR